MLFYFKDSENFGKLLPEDGSAIFCHDFWIASAPKTHAKRN
jgi:hypothetical protein